MVGSSLNRLFWTLLTAAVVTGFASLAHAADVERTARGVRFEGQIDAASVDLAFDLLRPGETLWIDSGGGQPDAAFRLARLMQDRKARLVVNGHCLDICATYVFLAAPMKSAS